MGPFKGDPFYTHSLPSNDPEVPEARPELSCFGEGLGLGVQGLGLRSECRTQRWMVEGF